MAGDLPPLPPGFTLDAPSSSPGSARLPPLPPGFSLDAPQESTQEKLAAANRSVMKEAISEPLANLATSVVAAPIAGVRGIFDVVTGQGADKASRDIESTQRALTYEPRSAAGKAVTGVLTYPFAKLAQGADIAGGKVSEVTHSPTLGAATNVAIQSIPALIGKGLGSLREGVDSEAAAVGNEATAATPEEAARSYVSQHTSLDWDALSDKFKQALTSIAKDAKSLKELNPQAVERQARLERLGVPATRGQVTRELPQLTREENLTKTDAGSGIRDIYAEQDRILHEHLDKLRGETGGKAETRGQVGASVQGAARSKLNTLRGQYQAAYAKAKEAGAGLEPADIGPLREWLKNPTNARNASYLKSAIADYTEKTADGKPLENGRITINDLEEIRKEATAKAKTPGSEGHYAKEAVGVIDQILDDSGSSVYKDARAKFKAVKDEFDRQGRIAGLVKNKGYTKDRAVALEDTFDDVVRRGSKEQLENVRDSLTKGGTEETRAKGIQAWKDLQAATIDYLKDAAAGKRAIPGEKSQLQFNSSFLDSLYDLDKDGKLDTLFGTGTSSKIRDIAEATRDVRTKPTGRIAGSDTAPRILNFLEKLSNVPGVGKYAAGVVKAGQKIASMGADTRAAAEAKSSPLESTAAQAEKAASKTSRATHTLRSIKKAAPTLPLTLQGDRPQ